MARGQPGHRPVVRSPADLRFLIIPIAKTLLDADSSSLAVPAGLSALGRSRDDPMNPQSLRSAGPMDDTLGPTNMPSVEPQEISPEKGMHELRRRQH